MKLMNNLFKNLRSTSHKHITYSNLVGLGSLNYPIIIIKRKVFHVLSHRKTKAYQLNINLAR